MALDAIEQRNITSIVAYFALRQPIKLSLADSNRAGIMQGLAASSSDPAQANNGS